MFDRESRFRGRPSARLRAGRLALLAFSAAAAPAVGHAEPIPLIHQHLVWNADEGKFNTVDLYVYDSLPAHQAFASAAEIMTRPAMGAPEDGFRPATLPLRYATTCRQHDQTDWSVATYPTPPEPYPAFARQLPAGDHVLFENGDVLVERREHRWFSHMRLEGYLDGEWHSDPWYNHPVYPEPHTVLRFRGGWTILVSDLYPVRYPLLAADPDWYEWTGSVTFVPPYWVGHPLGVYVPLNGMWQGVTGDVVEWNEFHLTQKDGTIRQELTAPGRYIITIPADGDGPEINVHIFKERLSSDGLGPGEVNSVLTDLLIETDGAWQVTFGRNAEVRAKADDWEPAAVSLVAYTDDTASGPEAMGPSRVFLEEARRRWGVLSPTPFVHDFSADELQVDFGRVGLGESWAMPLYFFNGGEQEVPGLGLSPPDDPAFAVEGAPEMNPSLPPEGWAIYDLRFEPPDEGPFEATMTTAAGLTIRLTGLGVVLGEGLLDVDRNHAVDALTDGLLVLRHRFGFGGAALTAGAVAGDCTRCDAETIEPYLDAFAAYFDIDGNGEVDALTDGLLILRYLFGFRGAPLIGGVVADDCTRCDAETIEAQLQVLASLPSP